MSRARRRSTGARHPNPPPVRGRRGSETVLAMAAVLLAAIGPAPSAAAQVERLAPGDTTWTFTGESGVRVRSGQDVIYLRRGRALLTDVVFSDGTIEFQFLPTDHRTFLGVLFRRGEGDHTEDIYLRLHKSGLPDAIQYTPDYRGHGQWQLYHGPGATAAARFAPGRWQRARIEVEGNRAAVFIGAAAEPQLVVDSLRAGGQAGHIGFWGNFPGASSDDPPTALLRDITVRHGETTHAFVPVERATVPGIVRAWGVSRSFPREGDVVREPPPAAFRGRWRTLAAEPSGLLPLDRDVARPDEGVPTVLAGLRIRADRARVARLDLGFSDDASVFLNGRLLYSGKNAFSHNFPRRQGLITLDQAALYLPLERGANELVLAVTEVAFGGWGIMGRVEDREGLRIEPLREGGQTETASAQTGAARARATARMLDSSVPLLLPGQALRTPSVRPPAPAGRDAPIGNRHWHRTARWPETSVPASPPLHHGQHDRGESPQVGAGREPILRLVQTPEYGRAPGIEVGGDLPSGRSPPVHAARGRGRRWGIRT